MSRNIHVIGSFNTGTNLLFNIINNCCCTDLNNNSVIYIKHQHIPFGKHTLDIKLIEQYLNNPDNLLIIMYKNIYNWLYSIKKECYDVTYSKLYLPVQLYGKQFPNMIELYNFYYINYMSILNRYSNAIFLDYEQIINLNTSFYYLNQKLSKINLFIHPDNFNSTLMTKSKNHGNPVNNTKEAQQHYATNKKLVRNFVNSIPSFNRSIKPILFDFYKNNPIIYTLEDLK